MHTHFPSSSWGCVKRCKNIPICLWSYAPRPGLLCLACATFPSPRQSALVLFCLFFVLFEPLCKKSISSLSFNFPVLGLCKVHILKSASLCGQDYAAKSTYPPYRAHWHMCVVPPQTCLYNSSCKILCPTFVGYCPKWRDCKHWADREVWRGHVPLHMWRRRSKEDGFFLYMWRDFFFLFESKHTFLSVFWALMSSVVQPVILVASAFRPMQGLSSLV